MARARSTLKPVSWPSASRKLNGGKSSVVTKRIACTAPAGGRSTRRFGSQKFGIAGAPPSSPVDGLAVSDDAGMDSQIDTISN